MERLCLLIARVPVPFMVIFRLPPSMRPNFRQYCCPSFQLPPDAIMRRTIWSFLTFAAIGLGLILAVGEGAAASLPCGDDEVMARTIPPQDKWVAAEPTRNLTHIDEGWIKTALGFDWRLIYTDTFAFAPMPAYRDTPRFFVQRWDEGWCGSGGCHMELFDCLPPEGKANTCKSVWSGFKGEVVFPGTSSDGHADFIVDGRDLYTWDQGRYRAVCNVTVTGS